jgi:hypothetical protein
MQVLDSMPGPTKVGTDNVPFGWGEASLKCVAHTLPHRLCSVPVAPEDDGVVIVQRNRTA